MKGGGEHGGGGRADVGAAGGMRGGVMCGVGIKVKVLNTEVDITIFV